MGVSQVAAEKVGDQAVEAAGAGEAGDLARELAGAFAALVECYREHYQLSPQDAEARAAGGGPGYLERALHGPPDQVSWCALDAVARDAPERALSRWEEIKQEAREEVRSGHRAARALEGYGGPCWGRAQFLAVRAELAGAWRSRNQQEQQLIDQLAQFQVLMERWQQTLTVYAELVAHGWQKAAKDRQQFEPPRVSDVEAVDRAAALVERFHRLYLRTLKALQDQRRLGRRVVRRTRQAVLAHQQVNVTLLGVP